MIRWASPALNQALDQVFGGNSGATAGDAGTAGTGTGGTGTGGTGTGGTGGTGTGGGSTPTASPTAGPSGAPTVTPTAPATGSAQAELADALQRASQAIKDSQAALQSGDFAAYGDAQKRLDAAVQDAVSAENRLGQGG